MEPVETSAASPRATRRLGEPAHGNAACQAQADGPVLSGFQSVLGLHGKAVHGGAREARHIQRGDDLLGQDAAPRPAADGTASVAVRGRWLWTIDWASSSEMRLRNSLRMVAYF